MSHTHSWTLTHFMSLVVCDNVSVGGWPQWCVCLRGTMFVLWGYADRWPGHLYVCGRTVPPLSASQREWIAVAARHTVVSVNLTSWAPDLPLTSMMPPDLFCHCTRDGVNFISRPRPIVRKHSELSTLHFWRETVSTIWIAEIWIVPTMIM